MWCFLLKNIKSESNSEEQLSASVNIYTTAARTCLCSQKTFDEKVSGLELCEKLKGTVIFDLSEKFLWNRKDFWRHNNHHVA